MEYEKTILSEEQTGSAIFIARFKTTYGKRLKVGRIKISQFALVMNGVPKLFKTNSRYNRQFINTLIPGEIVFVRYWETNRTSKDGEILNMLHRIGKSMSELEHSRKPT